MIKPILFPAILLLLTGANAMSESLLPAIKTDLAVRVEFGVRRS